MQTSRFQLGLIATLAVGLGFSLSSSDAVGYPAGAAVSMGSNPVVSVGGSLDGATSEVPLSAPSDASIVITGVTLSAYDYNYGCMGNTSVSISGGSGTLARFVVGLSRSSENYSGYEPTSVINLPSGIHIPADADVTVTATTNYESSCLSGRMKVDYTLSGYYAQS